MKLQINDAVAYQCKGVGEYLFCRVVAIDVGGSPILKTENGRLLWANEPNQTMSKLGTYRSWFGFWVFYPTVDA